MVTDGELVDLDETLDELVKGSDLPLSIIIVGVGPASFARADIFAKADEVPLYSKTLERAMKNNIVQFVPFRDYENNIEKLSHLILSKVRNQFLSYFQRNGIVPKPKVAADVEQPAQLRPSLNQSYF